LLQIKVLSAGNICKGEREGERKRERELERKREGGGRRNFKCSILPHLGKCDSLK
jgi:hypothetical protein